MRKLFGILIKFYLLVILLNKKIYSNLKLKMGFFYNALLIYTIS